MLKVELKGDRELIARFAAMPQKVHDALLHKVWTLALKLKQRVIGKLQGPVLRHRSGALSRSIFDQVTDNPTSVLAKIASSGDVKYAAIHEFGGRTPAHIIVPDKAKALAFMMGGKMMFAKVVNHPGSNMPERSFLRSSLGEMEDEIRDGMRRAVVEASLT